MELVKGPGGKKGGKKVIKAHAVDHAEPARNATMTMRIALLSTASTASLASAMVPTNTAISASKMVKVTMRNAKMLAMLPTSATKPLKKSLTWNLSKAQVV